MADKSFWTRFAEFFAGDYMEAAIAEGVGSVGGTIDPDDDIYRRLTGGQRDLNPIAQERAQTIAQYLWRSNPMAHRLTEMMADFVVGDGLTLSAVEEDVQELIDEVWNDPAMRLVDRHRDLVRDQSIYGELAFRCYVNDAGAVRFGLLLSERILDVEIDGDNAFMDAAVILKPPSGVEQPVRLEVVHQDEKSDPGNPTYKGEALYFGINRVAGQHRGTPDLLAVADYVDGYDQLLFNSLERSGLINAFIWDVTLQGATKAQVAEWVSEHGAPPPPGAVRAHNEGEVWVASAPNLGNADMMQLGRATKNMALGGLGAPEAWFAEGDSANRATLSEQGDPTYRMITRRQADVAAMFHQMLEYAIGQALEKGKLRKGIDVTFTVNLPEPSSRDTSKMAAALAQLATALGAAQEAKWISTKGARSLFLLMASGFGQDFNAEDEEEQIEEEAAEKEAEAPVMVPGEELPPMGRQPMQPPAQAPTNGAQPAQPVEV